MRFLGLRLRHPTICKSNASVVGDLIIIEGHFYTRHHVPENYNCELPPPYMPIYDMCVKRNQRPV